MKTINPKILLKIIKNIVLIVLVIILIYSLGYNICALFKINANFFGLNIYSIDSNTMSPELRKGYLVISLSTAPKNLKENDVIVYNKDDSNKVRRIVSMKENNGVTSLVVKGDNTYYMEEVVVGSIQGKMIAKIAFLGNILKMIQSIIFAIVVLVFFVFVYMRRRNARKRSERRKKYRIGITN